MSGHSSSRQAPTLCFPSFSEHLSRHSPPCIVFQLRWGREWWKLRSALKKTGNMHQGKSATFWGHITYSSAFSNLPWAKQQAFSSYFFPSPGRKKKVAQLPSSTCLHGTVAPHKSPLVTLLVPITRISSGGHSYYVPKLDGTFQTCPRCNSTALPEQVSKSTSIRIFCFKLSKLQIHNNLHLTGIII